MTTVITRYFENAADAQTAKFELVHRNRVSLRILDLFDDASGLAGKLEAQKVDAATAKAYETRVAKGGAVLLIRAGFKPLGVAKTMRNVCATCGAAELGDLVQEVTIKEPVRPALSILSDHPNFLTRPRDPGQTNVHMANWPIPLISRRKPANGTIFPRHARMANFPIPLISKRKPYTGSAIKPHGRMADFPIPLLSNRKPYTESMIEPHARMANFPIPLISQRKPFTGTIIGRHTRMANWPFPHLINGKTGTNALMPNGPRMANFPISLLSDRKPFTGSIFPRHARMANFPIPLLSGRKPYTGSIFPKHARMADFFLPLLFKGPNGVDDRSKDVFSLSKEMGIPTVIRR